MFLRRGTAVLTGDTEGSERAWGKDREKEREKKKEKKNYQKSDASSFRRELIFFNAVWRNLGTLLTFHCHVRFTVLIMQASSLSFMC